MFNVIVLNQINFVDFKLFGLDVKFLEFLRKLLFLFVSEIFLKNHQQNLFIYVCQKFQKLILVKLVNLNFALLCRLRRFCLFSFDAFNFVIQEVK